MKNIYKLISVSLLGLSLVGCESMNGSYDCPLQGTASCESLHDMDERVSNGEYWINGKLQIKSAKVSSNAELPHRVKIWTAPYEDENGVYHDASNHYMVLKG